MDHLELRLKQIKSGPRSPWIAYYKGHEACVAEARTPWQALDKLKRIFPAYRKTQDRMVTTVEQAENIEKEAKALSGKLFYPCGHPRTEKNSMQGGNRKWVYKRCKQCHYDNNNRSRVVRKMAELGIKGKRADELIEGYYTNEDGGQWLKRQLQKGGSR